MKRLVAPVLIACLALSFNFPSATAAVKQGAVCKKVGQVSTASGVKYTCTKSGSKLVWSKRAKATATTAPVVKDFEAWSTNIDSKTLSDQAERNFLSWAKSRSGAQKNHTQLIQANTNTSRIAIMKKADDLGAQLFSSYFPQGSKTFIGATQTWTDEQLANSGWVTKCDVPSMRGVAYCLGIESIHGYVVTGDAAYVASDPGSDGGSLLAHEYFHLVQRTLSKNPNGAFIKVGQPDTVNAFPAWFIEGTADYVGFAVGALSQNATYWQGRARMFSYSPPEESINKNAIADYEIRTCCGNNTPTYPYHIGRVATEYIVASIGFQKMLDIWVDVATTRNFETSFEKVTGISKEAFYTKFDQVRTKVGLPPVSWRLDGLVNKKIS
jgi:hypothetical protein